MNLKSHIFDFILQPSAFILHPCVLARAPIAAGFALLAADLAAAPWLGHERPPFLNVSRTQRIAGNFLRPEEARARYNARGTSIAYDADDLRGESFGSGGCLMVKLQAANCLLKPSQRRQLQSWLKRAI